MTLSQAESKLFPLSNPYPLENMRASVSQMIKDKLNKNASFGIQGYTLPSYNPTLKKQVETKKWQKDKSK